MNLISQSEFARIIEKETGEPFTRQAVSLAIQEGIIPFTLQGKKKMVDIENKSVQGYIRDNNRQREQAKKNDTSKLQDKKSQKAENASEFQDKKQPSLAIRNLKGGRFYSGKLRAAILERDGHKCVLCGKTPADGIRLEVDHIIEFEDGGETTYDNGQTLCAECNKGKSAEKQVSATDEFITLTEFGKRVGAHRNTIAEEIKKGRIDADRVTGKINYTTEILKWFQNKPTGDDIDTDGLSDFEIKQRIKKAELRKKELQVLILEKKYLPIEFIEDVYITYLERFNTTVERLAGTYIKDIGKDILNSGEVQPKHIEAFTQKILEIIHTNKKSVHKEKIKYEPRST